MGLGGFGESLVQVWVGLGKKFSKIPGVGAGLGKNCVGLSGFGDQ